MNKIDHSLVRVCRVLEGTIRLDHACRSVFMYDMVSADVHGWQRRRKSSLLRIFRPVRKVLAV